MAEAPMAEALLMCSLNVCTSTDIQSNSDKDLHQLRARARHVGTGRGARRSGAARGAVEHGAWWSAGRGAGRGRAQGPGTAWRRVAGRGLVPLAPPATPALVIACSSCNMHGDCIQIMCERRARLRA